MSQFGSTSEEIERMRMVPAAHFGEAVDVAYREFMTALHQSAARSNLSPTITFSWLLAQIADANPHWAVALGKMGYVNFPRANPYIPGIGYNGWHPT